MLTIRLQRTGRKNLATYRVVVTESARAAKGKFMKIIGFYLPQQKDSTFKIEKEEVQAWIKKGATPSDTLARLLKRDGMSGMEKFIKRYAKQRRKGEEPPAPAAAAPAPAPEAPAAEAPAGDSAPAEA